MNQRPPLFKNCENKIVALTPPDNPMTNYLRLLLSIQYNVSVYKDDNEVNNIIRDEQYGKNFPIFCFGVSFHNENNNYNYTLRINMS